MDEKQPTKSKRGGLRPGAGRKPGIPNKISGELKDHILSAARKAGDGDIEAYLERQAKDNPKAFLSLLGRVLPMTVSGTGEGGAITVHVNRGV